MYGVEYLPAFLNMIAYAFVGAYLNNQKSIETICRSDMVECATTILKVGAEVLNSGNISLAEAFANRDKLDRKELTEAQVNIILSEESIGIKLARGWITWNTSTPTAAVFNLAQVKHEVKKIMNSDDSVAEKKAKISKLRKGLKSGSTWRMKHGNLIPVVDKAIKRALYNKMDKICTDTLDELESKKD
jgi:hypothetical protein